MGNKLAYKAHRAGGAERCPDPAVHTSLAGDRALPGCYDPLRSALEWHLVRAAKPQDPHTLYRLQTVPGIGKILRLVLRYESHDSQRFPSGQEFVSYGRLVTCANESAGTRYGTAGTTSGTASLKGAFSEAAGLFLRDNPPGQQSLTRLAKTHGQGNALTLLAQQLGRAVDDLLKRHQAFDLHQLLQAS